MLHHKMDTGNHPILNLNKQAPTMTQVVLLSAKHQLETKDVLAYN